MMVALFVYAYAIGVRSSRAIERRCHDDVAFRVITANQAPDHATIARFRVRHEAAIAELFGEVLALCARSGLVKVGVVAVDGTKIAAAATHHATRSYEQIAREILEEAARIDAAEDELYGEARGDELPEGLRTSGDRRKVLREAKQALDAERAARGQEDPARPQPSGWSSAGAGCARTGSLSATSSPSTPPGMRPGSPATGRGGWSARATTSSPIRSRPSRRARSTSPTRTRATSRPRAGGCRATTPRPSSAKARSCSPPRSAPSRWTPPTWQPMIQTAIGELEAAGVTETPGVVLADAGYWKNDAIETLCGEGIPTLVAPDADRRKEPRPGRRGGRYDFARRVLATDWGKQLYLKRQGSVEPVFGQIKSNRGADRFQRRGRSAVRSEWRLLTATHNLLKLHRHQLATA